MLAPEVLIPKLPRVELYIPDCSVNPDKSDDVRLVAVNEVP